MNLGTEDNNVEKEKIRFYISQEISNYFGNRKYSMLELLGMGVGAEFFLAKQKAMSKISCIESDASKYNWWNSEKLSPLQARYPRKRIESFNIDFYRFCTLTDQRYDVINLDTMQYIGPKTYVSNQRTAFQHVEGIFKNDVITDDGLLLLNVIIDGFRIEQGKYKNSVCRTQNQILDLVKEAADNYGYDIDDTKASGYSYKSGGKGWTTMLHSVIPVIKRHA